ncbi:tetratricopeptide repeat protein [Gulosibacter faecalis]|uniref:Tetratricopeptide repeat protein n=1 Tax=Gulosibacter faecalis TaxID=272240 RepID=A0ABW5UZA2_9MICO|nr:hypothetical protein [Gulosibacter faecalis]
MAETDDNIVERRTVARSTRTAGTGGTAVSSARRRRRLRRHLLLWSLPIAIVLLLTSAKLIAQHVIAQSAISQYASGDYEQALNTSGQLKFLNVVEPWKPFYNMGTSYLQLEALPEAQEQLRAALDLATPPEQCPIRANLAIAIEREGDLALEAEDADTAMAKYGEALGVLEEADPSCELSTSNRSITDSDERIRQKLEELQQPEDGEGGDGDEQQDGNDGDQKDPDASPDPDSLDELEDGMGENQEDRRNDVDNEENGYGGGSQPDQPW